MPRPLKQGLDYFPLDTDFFTNKKLKSLRRAHGSIGVLTYLNLLCRVYRNGYYYKFEDLDELSMDIAEEIACSQLRATATCVTETINYLVGRGILNQGLLERGIISGVALQEQYVLSAYKAKRNIKMDMHCLVDVNLVMQKNKVYSEETAVYSEETKVHSEFGTQSKIKDKVKDKVKVKENTTTTHSNLNYISIARTREEKPSDMDLLAYFSKQMCEEEAAVQAYRFKRYNEKRCWDCLPDWQGAAEAWIGRIRT